MNTSISDFIKKKRKQLNLTQPELAGRAGVGLRFIRELEQGKQSVRLDKVNQVLALFGSEVGVQPITKRKFDEVDCESDNNGSMSRNS